MHLGALGIVMHVSRVVGAAPFTSSDPEWRASRPLLVYSGVLTTLIAGCLLLNVALPLLRYDGAWLALDFMRLGGRALAVLLLAAGARSAPARCRRAARTLRRLRQISAKLPRRIGWQQAAGADSILILLPFAACTVLRFVDGLADARAYEQVFTTLSQVAISFAFCFESLIVLQIVLVTRRVAATVADLNGSLQQFIPTAYPPHRADGPRNAGRARPARHCAASGGLSARAARRGARCWRALRAQVRAGGAADGPFVLGALLQGGARLGMLLYAAALGGLLVDRSDIGYPTTTLLFCALFLVTLVTIIEPFHNTHVEMQRTHFLVTSLQFYSSGDGGASNELRLFLRLLALDSAAYSPLGVCRLERRVAAAMFASITTYLVIALTYGPEVKKPSLLASYARIGLF